MAPTRPAAPLRPLIPHKPQRAFAVLQSAVLFCLACGTPAMIVIHTGQTEEKTYYGAELLATGWMGVLSLNIGWYANPLLALALFLLVLGADRGARVVGVAAAIVGLSSLSWYAHPLPADEGGGRYIELLYPSIGFVLWMGSLLIPPFTAHSLSTREATTRAPEPTP